MSTPEQLAVASLCGEGQRWVEQETPVDEAVASLREITTASALLAEAAGILAGTADPNTGERPWRIAAARLLVAAGADKGSLPEWIEQGRSNVARAVGWDTARAWPDDLDEVLADVLREPGTPTADEALRAEFEELAKAQGVAPEDALAEARRLSGSSDSAERPARRTTARLR